MKKTGESTWAAFMLLQPHVRSGAVERYAAGGRLITINFSITVIYPYNGPSASILSKFPNQKLPSHLLGRENGRPPGVGEIEVARDGLNHTKWQHGRDPT